MKRSALTHRQFQSLFEEMDSNVPFYTAVRWLSCGKSFGPMFSFLIKPESFDGQELDSSLTDWLETQDMEMQLMELKSSTLWLTKFAELRKQRAGSLHPCLLGICTR